jgi:hypothetical protein
MHGCCGVVVVCGVGKEGELSDNREGLTRVLYSYEEGL